VWRLCSPARIFSAHSRRRGTAKRPGPPVHDDLVHRDFTADAPNQLWLTDMTEHHTDEGKLYLCAIKDVYSARIVGYSIDSRMKTRIAVNALSSAVSRRGGPVASCTVHSDRSSQFRSRRFVEELKHQGLTGSMGPVGAARDNAAMESLFALLQKKVLNRQRWRTRDELRLAIVIWIERTCHRRRRQRALGKLTPIEFETIYAAADAA
jgi:transposase InsO family protein